MSDDPGLFGLPTARSPREAALYCCQEMSLSFAHPRWPLGLYRDDTGRHGGEAAQRAGYAHRAAAALRGAFWARVTLAACVRPAPQDPDEMPRDEEAGVMLSALDRYLAATWGIDGAQVPATYSERDSMASGLAATIAKRLPWRDEYKIDWPNGSKTGKGWA